MNEDRSLRTRLEAKMPAPLAGIVVDYLQVAYETQRERYRRVMEELRWYGDPFKGKGSTTEAIRHIKGCSACPHRIEQWMRGEGQVRTDIPYWRFNGDKNVPFPSMLASS